MVSRFDLAFSFVLNTKVSAPAPPVRVSLPAPPLMVTAAVAVVFADRNVTAKLAAVSTVTALSATTPEASKLVIAVLPALVRVSPLLPVTTTVLAPVATSVAVSIVAAAEVPVPLSTVLMLTVSTSAAVAVYRLYFFGYLGWVFAY